jgi:pyruvate/2-oxoglutarate dehydrogenase complex dihydrolipoamide dehydrogenase (E3) component
MAEGGKAVVRRKLVPRNFAQVNDEKIDGRKHVAIGVEQSSGSRPFGVGAGEILAAVQIAMIAGLPYTALRDAVLTHPTLVEGLIPPFSSAPSAHNVAEKRRAQTSST